MPPVSVIVPVYNRPSWSLRAVVSILAQSFTDYEIIVVDDGSQADMVPVQRLTQAAGGVYLRTDNRGPGAARNLGAAAASGKWLAFLDSDDVWLEKKLEQQVSFLKRRADLRICQTEEIWYRRGRFANQKKEHAKPEGESFFRSLRLCCISPSSVMLERRLFEECGGFDERMKVCEDYDLWLRITWREPVGLIREALTIKYGGHEDQLSRSVAAMDRYRVFALLKIAAHRGLNNEQRCAVFREIAVKAEILANGAAKRGRVGMAELYRRLAEEAAERAVRNDETGFGEDTIAQICAMLGG